MKTKCSLLATLLLLLAAGCAPVTISTTQVGPEGLPTHVHGMPYFLPIGLITIKGEYKEPEKPPSPTTTAKSGSESVSTESVTPTPSPVQRSSPPTEVATSNSITISVSGWTVTVNGDVEPDPSLQEFAQPQRNYIYDDDYHLTVNSKHLLSTGNATAEDRTANVIGQIASLVTSVTGVPLLGARVAEPPKKRNQPFYLSFHTDNCGEYKAAKEVLVSRGFSLVLDPRPCPAESKNPIRPPRLNVDGANGLVFRLAQPYQVSLTYTTLDGDSTLKAGYRLLLPGLDEYVLDYNRVPFVKKVTEIGFTDGMLTDYHENLPSPVLGVLGIPKSIVGAIVPLPSGISSGGSGSTSAVGSTP